MRRLAPGLWLLALSASLCSCAQAPGHAFPVFFTPFSSQLDGAATGIVASAAAAAKQFPTAQVTVVGYADPVGGPDDNIKLSQARADAVAAALLADGVPSERISRRAGGTPPNSQPGVQDRRAEIDIGS